LIESDNFGAVVEIDAEAGNGTKPRRETKARSSPQCSPGTIWPRPIEIGISPGALNTFPFVDL
jgi:hypothetical protein